MQLRDRITRLRAVMASDGYGNAKPTWAGAAELDMPAEVQPISSAEDNADQDRTTTRWRLFLGPTADLLATDRVRWDGQVYLVDGDVERWKRRGTPHHVEAVLKKITQN